MTMSRAQGIEIEGLQCMTARPFRFGLVATEAGSAEAWREKARRAEAIGYDILLVPDHIVGGRVGWAPALMAAAAATSTLRVGTNVLDNDFRHPAFVAQDVATLDMLTDGRFEFGIGAGWLLEDYTKTGIAWEAPGIRAGRMEEAVQIITQLLEGKTVTFTGKHYSIDELPPSVLPVQQPRPPLMIGAGGPRLSAFAARHADIFSVVFSSRREGGLELDFDAASVATKIARVREAAGDRFDQIELNTLLQGVFTADQRDVAANDFSAALDTPAETFFDSPYFLFGSPDEIADTLQRRREDLGISYYSVFDRHWEALDPVVKRLAGT
jgi:probable F420-dependent oxidoreductase